MQSHVEELLAAEIADGDTTATMDQLLGAVYDESDRCNIAWSDYPMPEAEG